MDALRAPDSDQFIAAIRKEVHSLISETRTLQPLSRTTAPNGYSENNNRASYRYSLRPRSRTGISYRQRPIWTPRLR
jgi:hypothetical protein